MGAQNVLMSLGADGALLGGHVGDALQDAAQAFAGFPAGFIVRITGDHHRRFTAQPDLLFDQHACFPGIVLSPVRRINVISDMAVIVYASAFPAPIADLADLMPVVVQCDFPDLLMPEAQFPVWLADVQRNQIDLPVGILRSVMSKQHVYTS